MKLIFPALLLLLCVAPAQAENRVLVEALVRASCQHCAAEKAFLQTLPAQRSEVEVRVYDIAEPEGSRWFKAITGAYRLPLSLPLTVVGSEIIQGYDSADTTGAHILALVDAQRGQPVQGFASLLAAAGQAAEPAPATTVPSLLVRLPLLGTVDAGAWSLPVLASLLGLLDGFNPCAMWVLVTFLLVLLRIGSRRRMWTVAGLFIVAEALMYYLILNVWFKAWDFVGMDRYVTPAVGLVAIGGGLFFLYEWYKSLGTELACRIIDLEQRSRITQRIKRLADGPFTLLTVAGIIGLAFSVNVIEFACSIGYPQTFTKIIEMNQPGFWTSQFYLGLYILFYMADDFAVFGLALWGFEQIHLTQRYSRWSNGLGGVLMLLLGALLLLHPDWLRFG